MLLNELYIAELNFGKLARGAVLGAALLGGSYAAQSRPTSQPSTQSQPASKPAQSQPADGIDYEYIATYIANNEGRRNRVYDDGRGNPTIGIGHMLTSESRGIFNRLFGDSVDFDAVVSGKQRLTNPQVDKLFASDLAKHIRRVRAKFPDFTGYSRELQAAIADAVYRGDMTNAVAKLINNEEFQEAAKMYLRYKQYINRQQLGIPGIGPRMECNAAAFASAE